MARKQTAASLVGLRVARVETIRRKSNQAARVYDVRKIVFENGAVAIPFVHETEGDGYLVELVVIGGSRV